MTKEQAMHLMLFEKDYVAKPVRRKSDVWGVWCTTSDHWVEFDQATIDRAGQVNPETNEYVDIGINKKQAEAEAYICADCGYVGHGAWNCDHCGEHNLIRS